MLLFIIILCCTFGVVHVSFNKVINIIINKITRMDSSSNIDYLITIMIRLPRILVAALVGAGLSLVGASFQSIFRNQMADPYVIGISSGAALGATIGIVFCSSTTVEGFSVVSIFAFIGAFLTTLVVYNIARVGNKVPPITLMLSGIAFGALLSSIISFIMVFNRTQVEKILFWTMGSFSNVKWIHVIVLLGIIIAGTIIINLFARELNVISTGDDAARSLGIDVERTKKIIIIISAMMIAACVSIGGIIGFVGLIIPHSTRFLLKTSDHRVVLPFSAVIGAVFMVLCDTFARTFLAPTEMPIGVITSLIGAPYFIYLLIKVKRNVT